MQFKIIAEKMKYKTISEGNEEIYFAPEEYLGIVEAKDPEEAMVKFAATKPEIFYSYNLKCWLLRSRKLEAQPC